MATRVTLLGTGVMGAGMARSMLRGGLEVTVWNRDPVRAAPLAQDGARVAGDVGAALRDAEVGGTMLFDADAVLDVMQGPLAQGLFPAGAVWLQTTTTGLDGTARLAGLARQSGVAFVDAPVLGTKKPAQDGVLQVFCAGPHDTRERLAPVLDAISSRVLWLGDEPGAASALKLVCNAWIATITSATAQSVALAEGLGLDPALFLDAIKAGPQNSEYAQLKGAVMARGAFDDVSFTVDGALKDVRLIRDAMVGAKVDHRLVDAVEAQFADASGRGHGGEDMGAVLHAYR